MQFFLFSYACPYNIKITTVLCYLIRSPRRSRRPLVNNVVKNVGLIERATVVAFPQQVHVQLPTQDDFLPQNRGQIRNQRPQKPPSKNFQLNPWKNRKSMETEERPLPWLFVYKTVCFFVFGFSS